MDSDESRSAIAYRQIAGYIDNVADGARLPPEADFAEMFGLSRASIREALARLRAEGIVRSRKGSGTFAIRTGAPEMVRLSAISSLRELAQWHEVRLALESEVAALAADRRTEDDLARLQAAQEALLASLLTGRGEREDVAFHAALAVCAHNPKLSDALGRLTSHIFSWGNLSAQRSVLTMAERRELIALEHGAIVAAVAARDGDRARAEMRRHLLAGRMRVLSDLQT
ncbi:GntR family transcriptional regulator [Bosea sp. AK1]|jgi:DNA-binding FadR family transcriptional regulator|uniref:FadR/GntR family transcriptional regulator n=1 Tax=Bosea sp. AK1 TaxID=2587160 RepID=UPI001150AC5E|nr:FCD domain-containing protein [Bosea sp. AK1]TQI74927.1 GntR family transcriptional regulator [Bosea sp. AK1]